MSRDPERPAWEGRGDVADELEFHLEMMRERLLDEGWSEDEADAEARRRLGDEPRILAEARALDRRLERRERLSDYGVDLAADLKLAVRSLALRPGFTAAAVLSLALAIGATTALFSVVHGVLLRPLDYHAPEELALLSAENTTRGWDGMPLPQGVFAELQETPDPWFDLAVYVPRRATLLSSLEPRRLRAAAISRNLLPLLGVEPSLGRGLSSGDPSDVPGQPCLVSHRLWQRDLGGSERALGQLLRLEGDVASCRIVGVLPGGFAFPDSDTDLWSLYELDTEEPLWGSWFLRGVARIEPGRSLEVVQARLDERTAQWSEDLPFGGDWRFVLADVHAQLVQEVAPGLWALFGAVALVLMIACVNLGGMLVARTTERQGELALRSALGATQARLARQLLAENLLLCALGGGLGILIAHAIVHAVRTRPPVELPRHELLTVDAPVLAFAAAVVTMSTLLSWIAPVVQALRGRASVGTSRVTRSPGRARLRALLVVAETAMAVALLIGAGLLLRSFLRLTAVEPGFETLDVVSLHVELPESRYGDEARRRAFFDDLQERVEGLPFVSAAGLTTGLPLQGVSTIDRLQILGESIPEEERPQVAIDAVTPGYFRSLGVPLLEGRHFAASDLGGAVPVTIVNAELARRHFTSGSPLGRYIVQDEDQEPLLIVGVVGSVKQFGLREEAPLEYYLPFAQSPRGSAHLVVRSELPLEAVGRELKVAVSELDEGLPVVVSPLDAALSRSVDGERFYAQSMGAFAGLAALLVTLGLYGLIAFTVEARKTELGIRMALGARRSTVFRSITTRGLLLGGTGTVLGLCLALLLARSLSGLLFGVGAFDPWTFALSAALVLAISALAAAVPARRAVRLDPARALRSD